MVRFPMNAQAANFSCFAAVGVDVDNDTLKCDVLLGNFELAGQLGKKSLDHGFFFHADDGIQRTAHAHIGDISRASR